MAYQTEQEAFWEGKFGDEYTKRNRNEQIIVSNIALFSRILSRTRGIQSCLELGANRGLNLVALGRLIPGLQMQAVEINKSAADECVKIENVNVFHGSAFEYTVEEGKYDLAFTKGVLIHIHPDKLNDMYDMLYRSSKRYVLICEYYNPTPVEVKYRGHEQRLFKRDFAGEMLDRFDDLVLVDYGFVYHRDYVFPADDGTWFLMEKSVR